MWVRIKILVTHIILCPYPSHVVPPILLISRRRLLLHISPMLLLHISAVLLLVAIAAIVLLLAVSAVLLIVVVAAVALLIVSFTRWLRPCVRIASDRTWQCRFVLARRRATHGILFRRHVAMPCLRVIATLAVMVMFDIMPMTPAVVPVVVVLDWIHWPLRSLLSPVRSSSSTSHVAAGVVRAPIVARALLVRLVLLLRRLILRWWLRRHLLHWCGRWAHGKICDLLLEHANALLERPHLLLSGILLDLSLLLCGVCLLFFADGG